MKKTILMTMLVACALPLCAAENPNILFLMVDDLGWTDMSTGKPNLGNGSDYYETPHLDSLASKGMSFPFAYSNGPNCAPTRATLYSGQYSTRTKCYNVQSANRGGKNAKLRGPDNKEYLDLGIVTFAESVKKKGYVTAHFGKWHVGGHLGGGLPTEQGFDLNMGGIMSAAQSPVFLPSLTALFKLAKVNLKCRTWAQTEKQDSGLTTDLLTSALRG